MTKQHLQSVLEALAQLIEDWNDMAADGDRGRANDALCLVLFDDGSGSISTIGLGPLPPVTNVIQCNFDTLEQAVEYLAEEFSVNEN